jgi:hypothetical protein
LIRENAGLNPFVSFRREVDRMFDDITGDVLTRRQLRCVSNGTGCGDYVPDGDRNASRSDLRHSPGHHDSNTSALNLSAASQRLAAGIKLQSSGQMRADI